MNYPQNANDYLKDYIFYRAIQDVNNHRRTLAMSNTENSVPLITVRQAVNYRDEFMRQYSSMDTGFYNRTVDALSNVFDGTESVEFDVDKIRSYQIEFSVMAGMSRPSNGKGFNDNNFVVPVSPYMPEFRTRESVLKSGSRLLGLHVETALKENNKYGFTNVSAYGQDNDGNDIFGVINGDVSQLTSGYSNMYGISVSQGGAVETYNDETGLARLAPFMTKKEYTAITESGWLDDVSRDTRISDEALGRSVAVLEWMQENGIEYEIKPDSNRGQLKATVKGTKLDVRLLDDKRNESYIGARVYNDGITARYYVAGSYMSKADKDAMSRTTGLTSADINRQLTVPSELTNDDAIRLLQFSLGQTVARPDGRGNIGSTALEQLNRNDYKTNSAMVHATSYNHAKSTGFTSFVRPYTENGNYKRGLYAKLAIKQIVDRVNDFYDSDNPVVMEQYLRDAIDSAKKNYHEEFNLEQLIQESREHKNDAKYVPDFSSDEGIAAQQREYWDKLTIDEKLNHEASDISPALGAAFEAIDNEAGDIEEEVRSEYAKFVDSTFGQYDVDSEGKRFNPLYVARYMDSTYSQFRNNENLLTAMRTCDIQPNEVRGDEFYNDNVRDGLIKFDTSSALDMKSLSAGRPFMQSMYDTVVESLKSNGCEPASVMIDKNGIVQYKAKRFIKQSTIGNGPFDEEVTGQIGQIFEPDELGGVETKFAGTDNYVFVPGYSAYVVPQKDGENKSLEERMRLVGYQQTMIRNIQMTIQSDLYDEVAVKGSPTNLNNTYRHLYDTRHNIQEYHDFNLDDINKDVARLRIQTEASRINMGDKFKQGSTTNADFRAKMMPNSFDSLNDNFSDPYLLTGQRNLAVLTRESDGYFDPILTGTATNQGVVRYLVKGAKVNTDGSIVRSDDLNDRAPLFDAECFRNMEFNPFDRNQMAATQVMTAKAITRDVGVAQMTVGGWTMDDAYVVSKQFAKDYEIIGADGNVRPLMKGDKISDMNGNKGVISVVIDPELHTRNIAAKMEVDEDSFEPTDSQGWNMDGIVKYNDQEFNVSVVGQSDLSDDQQIANQIQEQLGYKDLDTLIDLFDKNPNLDIVGAPFAAVGRFNGGSVRTLMEPKYDEDGNRKTTDIVMPNGSVKEGCMGYAPFIITDMPVDEKTHEYGEAEIAQGKGRKASAQLAWGLTSRGCENILDSFYNTNNSSLKTVREYLINMGLDIDSKGNLADHYEPQEGEVRNVFALPELKYRTSTRTNPTTKQQVQTTSVDMAAMMSEFKSIVSEKGGFLELPFQLTYATGENMPMISDEIEAGRVANGTSKVDYKTSVYYRTNPKTGEKIVCHRNPELLNGNIETVRHNSTEVTQAKPRTYAFPIMSSYMRSGNELQDGTNVVHDYTQQYINVYKNAISYMAEYAKGDEKNQRLLDSYQRNAQAAYNTIATDIKTRKFTGKHNMFREDLMSNRLPNSATAVWTPDPRLDIDQIAIPTSMSDTLGVKEDDYILTWRDPILKDGGIRYMRVKLDDTLVGCAINPVMDKSYDGDFDGDSIGLARIDPKNKAAIAEAMEMLSVKGNLLDRGTDASGNHPLYINTDLDMATIDYELNNENGKLHGQYPELEGKKQSILDMLNEKEPATDVAIAKMQLGGNAFDTEAKRKTIADITKYRKEAVAELSNYVKTALSLEYGHDMICFKDLDSCVKSAEHMVEDGAKGSYGKLDNFYNHCGVEIQRGDDKRYIPGTATEPADVLAGAKPHTNHTREDDIGTEYATSVRSFGTGLAGTAAQNTASAFRNMGVVDLSKATDKDGNPRDLQDVVNMMYAMQAALESTYVVTQTTLQSKHDPIQAAMVYKILQTSGPDVWSGKKMFWTTDAENKPIYRAYTVNEYANTLSGAEQKSFLSSNYEDKKLAMQATPDEWLQNFDTVFCSEDKPPKGYGLGFKVNPEAVDVAAKLLTDETGNVRDIKSMPKSALDELAYGGSFETCVNISKEGRYLFEGRYTEHFAPSIVKFNRTNDGTERPDKALVKSDTTVKSVDKSDANKSVDVEKAYSLQATLSERADARKQAILDATGGNREKLETVGKSADDAMREAAATIEDDTTLPK